MIQKHVELLAPAGNPESFYAAINAGADAIYFAGAKFGARAYADNFTTDEVIKAIQTAHIYGIRVYMTVNTLLKQTEIDELYDYLLPYYQAGLDGVIIQDMGVFHFLKNHFPGLELHISTQVSLCSSYGAQFMKDNGACRIVPAREISLEEIKEIKSKVDIQIETFIHGAMCYCYSGQCLFSSILGGRSGNRGRCAQPCRLPYSVKDNKNITEGHLLSLKDMCTIFQLPDLIEAGIDSFKIEGRMKRPEYVAGVCSIYRKYIDNYYALRDEFGLETARQKFHISKDDQRLLNSLYIRSEIHNGYYYKHNGKEMITLDSPAYSDTKDELLTALKEKYIDTPKKLPLSVYGYFEVGFPAIVSLSCGEYSVSVEGDIVEQASRSPITEDNVRKQLTKLGDTSFVCEEFACQLGENSFYPLKSMNELRREATERLTSQILAAYSPELRTPNRISEQKASLNIEQTFLYKISIQTVQQLSVIESFVKKHPDSDIQMIFIDSDAYLRNRDTFDDFISHFPVAVQFGLAMPYILRKRDDQYLQKLIEAFNKSQRLTSVLVRSMDSYAFVIKHMQHCSVYLDANVYNWNKEAVQFYQENVSGFCIPYELKAGEQHQLPLKQKEFDKIVYSRLPMMITANCIRRTAGECHPKETSYLQLKDRYGKEFPVATVCSHCYNIIYNSVPLSLHKELSKWKDFVNFRLDFTTESALETADILTYFFIQKGEVECPYEYTTGHEKRGVE